MSDPIIYGPDISTYTRSLRLALEEKDVPYTLEPVDIMGGAHKNPKFLARQPFGKVPAFSHGDFSMYETAPTMEYIDEAFDGPALKPSDPHTRARMRQIMSIVDSYAYGPWITQILIPRLLGNAEEDKLAEALPLARTSMQVLDALVGDGPYCCGNAVSLADLHLTPPYYYFRDTPEGQQLRAGTPNLEKWWANMSTRPSVERTKPNLG